MWCSDDHDVEDEIKPFLHLASGVVKFDVGRPDQQALEHRAAELLKQAWNTKFGKGHQCPLDALATMPEDIAVAGLKRYLLEKNGPDGPKRTRDVAAAVHNLIFVDTTAAVDLIVQVANSIMSRNGREPYSWENGSIDFYAVRQALNDFYATTKSTKIRKHIEHKRDNVLHARPPYPPPNPPNRNP